MQNKLYFKVTVPIILLMLGLGTSLYFVVLRTVHEFAQQNINQDLEALSHDLFNIIDYEYMQAIKTGRIDDNVTLRISQVDCLDILERKTLSHQFKLLVFEEPTHTVRLASPLPKNMGPYRVIERLHISEKKQPLQIGEEKFYIREFYFSPWKWNILMLKSTKDYGALSKKVHQVYLASIAVLFMATFLFVYYLLYNIKTPITSIISSLKQGESPRYKGIYEFEYLSDAVTEMKTSLQDEVRERKHAEQKAEAASRAKSEFLANMSHELRTPLNAILGFAQIMERNTRDTSDEVALRIIKRSGNHLLTLINQILDLSRIEAGQITITEQSFDLLTLLDELKSMLLLKAVKKEISLLFDINEDVPRYIRTDEMKLRQILINLLNNAIKFTDEGDVTLRISCQKNVVPHDQRVGDQNIFLLFAVEDTGVGIAKEDIANLFQAFSRASTVKKTKEGTGLGLVICKKFVEFLGGKITLDSEPGRGSTFSFTLPVQIADKKQTIQSKSNARVIGLKPDQPPYRLLVVDDKWDNRQMLIRLLESIGFLLCEAENGEEALTLLDEWKPHLILMDIRMPVMDGITATKKIRAQKSPEKQPIIVAITASILDQKLESLLNDGFDNIIIKPFKEVDLFAVLKKHLGVEYVYDDEKIHVAQGEDSTRATDFSPSDFYTLPQETVEQLKRSISTLKMNEALDVIELIKGQNEQLAKRLHKLVLEYRFDTLQSILDQNEWTEYSDE